MPASPARVLAAGIVNAVLLEGRSLTQALAAVRAQPGGADARALAAAQSLAYGVLRDAGRLRFFLGELASRPLNPPELLGALLTGLHELDTGLTPAYAAVNETVAVVAATQPRARGFCNAILRGFQRQRQMLGELAQADEAAHWNFPGWWLQRLREAYPQDWQAVVAVQNTHPPMTLRVNRRRTEVAAYLALLQAAGIAARPLTDSALLLEHPVPVGELPHFHDGWVSVQDQGAQWAAPLLDCHPGMRVLDACAAPGGKTAHLLEMCDLDVLALDSDVRRLTRVRETLQRLGLRAEVAAADAGDVAAWWQGEPFDRILLDAPCTASGVVRRHPDGKWLKREEDMQQLTQQQSRLLDALWPLLKPGGKMLYATCSLFPAENVGQIDAFLMRHADARNEPLSIPGACGGQLRPGPETDGFFYARLFKT